MHKKTRILLFFFVPLILCSITLFTVYTYKKHMSKPTGKMTSPEGSSQHNTNPSLDTLPFNEPFFLAGSTPHIPVVTDLATNKTIELPRGMQVYRTGELITLKGNSDSKNALDDDKVINPLNGADGSKPLNDAEVRNLKDSSFTHQTHTDTPQTVALSNVTELTNEEQSLESVWSGFPIEYTDAQNQSQTAYVPVEFLVSAQSDAVREETLFVRTPTHLYSQNREKLIQPIFKGTPVHIKAFEGLDSTTGLVKWYFVNINDGAIEGWVRGKYLTHTQALANEDYNENNFMVPHQQRGNTLDAGSASGLDFYPRKKANFENNKMPEKVKALYINSSSIQNAKLYLDVAKDTGINAFVVDIKDNTTPAYPADAMKTYSPTNYMSAQNHFNSEDTYADGIRTLKEAGYYLIGRITVFKDQNYVKDHPEHAILNLQTQSPYLHNNTYWPSPFVRDVWIFNVALAKEAVRKFGFNEIQFDYIRFPDRTYYAEKNGIIDFKNTYAETKSQVIQRFAMFAVDELHDIGAYVSGDVFGESAHEYVTAYGQYWAALSNVFDVISPMAYPDHFSPGNYGFDYPWLYPYDLLRKWSFMAMARQQETPTPAIIRPWIQSHDAVRSPSKKYGPTEISEQIRAYQDGGIDHGYMTWWGSSQISGYESEKEAYR